MSKPITADQVTPERIREARELLGISQTMLANRLGTHQPRIAEWENGTHRPSRLYRQLLAVTYNGAIERAQNGGSDEPGA